jgi:hypothetical protein
MNVTQQFVDEDVAVARRESDGGYEVAVDFGPNGDPTVDVVGDTVIVVDRGDQYELEMEGDAQAVIENGVLTIEVNE